MNFTKYFVEIAKEFRTKFTLNNKSISLEQIFDHNGLLPGLFKRADQLSSFCLGKNLGVKFKDNPNATLGITFDLDDSICNSFRLLCVTEILCEIIEASPDQQQVPLDTLLYD